MSNQDSIILVQINNKLYINPEKISLVEIKKECIWLLIDGHQKNITNDEWEKIKPYLRVDQKEHQKEHLTIVKDKKNRHLIF